MIDQQTISPKSDIFVANFGSQGLFGQFNIVKGSVKLELELDHKRLMYRVLEITKFGK